MYSIGMILIRVDTSPIHDKYPPRESDTNPVNLHESSMNPTKILKQDVSPAGVDPNHRFN